MNLHLSTSAILTIVHVLLSFSLVGGEKKVYCYQCIKFNCAKGAEPDICKDVQSFVIDQVRKSYDIPAGIENCPDADDVAQWSLLQIETNACPNKDSVCAVERVEVETLLDSYGTVTAKSSATVLGCASQDLRSRMMEKNEYNCNVTKPEGTFRYPDIKHYMKMEHCTSPETECKSKDWCVEPSRSEIQKFTTVPPTLPNSFFAKVPLLIGIGVVCAIVFLAWGACHFCNLATYKTSYIPKSGFEETDSVIVVKNKTNSRREYETADTIAHKKQGEEDITILNENSL